MVWPFRKTLSRGEKDALIAFVRHCQFMIASQQLTMELFNDALARASDSLAEGDELFVRSFGGVSDPELASKFILTALRDKVQVLEAVKSLHEAVSAGTSAEYMTFETSNLFSAAIDIWAERGRLQLQSWSDWVDDPSLDVSSRMSLLDNSEMQATGVALNALNSLIRMAGLGQSEFLEINRQAFNVVRARRNLRPLPQAEFAGRYSSGRAGQRARFFSD